MKMCVHLFSVYVFLANCDCCLWSFWYWRKMASVHTLFVSKLCGLVLTSNFVSTVAFCVESWPRHKSIWFFVIPKTKITKPISNQYYLTKKKGNEKRHKRNKFSVFLSLFCWISICRSKVEKFVDGETNARTKVKLNRCVSIKANSLPVFKI